MSQNVPKLKQSARRKKVIEFRVKGWNIANIASKLHVNEKTVDRDLQSIDVKAFDAELIRRQLDELEGAEKIETRLHFRDRLLDKLLPKKVEQKVSGELKQEVEFPELREGDIARFFTTIARLGMEKEDRETASDNDQKGSPKSVDPKDSKP
jgi:IS30 family transposase